MTDSTPGMVDPAIFEDLQAKIDEDTAFRDEIKDIVQTLEKQGTKHMQPTMAIKPTLTFHRAFRTIHSLESAFHAAVSPCVTRVLYGPNLETLFIQIPRASKPVTE